MEEASTCKCQVLGFLQFCVGEDFELFFRGALTEAFELSLRRPREECVQTAVRAGILQCTNEDRQEAREKATREFDMMLPK